MNKQEQVQQMTTYMANFVSHIAKVLPDDIIAKLDELGAQEDAPLSKVIYETMKRNQKLAKELNRPSCQDTGVLQFWVKCGVDFPLIGEVEGLLKEAVVKATFEAPLRHNSVETFDEFNTGRNVGKGTRLHGRRRLHPAGQGYGSDARCRLRRRDQVRHGCHDQLRHQRLPSAAGGRGRCHLC